MSWLKEAVWLTLHQIRVPTSPRDGTFCRVSRMARREHETSQRPRKGLKVWKPQDRAEAEHGFQRTYKTSHPVLEDFIRRPTTGSA